MNPMTSLAVLRIAHKLESLRLELVKVAGNERSLDVLESITDDVNNLSRKGQ